MALSAMNMKDLVLSQHTALLIVLKIRKRLSLVKGKKLNSGPPG